MNSDSINYLTMADLYTIAEQVLGRRPDVRERQLLRSAANRPMLHAFGHEAYPTLLDKAAALMHSLAAHHVFFDGNKRTATQATIRFLHENGLEPTWDEREIYQFVLEVAQNMHDVPAIARWLADHIAPKYEPPGHQESTEPATNDQQPTTSFVRYLTLDELIYINERLPNSHRIHTILKGKQRVRDMDLLEAAAGRPMHSAFGQDAYPTPQEKAAALLHSIARNHPFADGNKRTATIAVLFMLEVNGLCVTWDPAEALARVVELAEGKSDLAEFAEWLPVEDCAPSPEPDAEADMLTIERIMTDHRWLLEALAKR